MKKKCPWCESEKTQMHLWVKDLFLTGEAFEIHECLKCGLLFTEPRPNAEEIGKYYQSEEYYSHQENKTGFIPRIYETVKGFNLKKKYKMATIGMAKGKKLLSSSRVVKDGRSTCVYQIDITDELGTQGLCRDPVHAYRMLSPQPSVRTDRQEC